MNWSLGFGLEKIGLAVLRFPRVATVMMLISLVLSVVALPRMGFDGNIINVIDEKSQAFDDFAKQAEQFHDYSNDVSVILRSDSLVTAQTMEGLRNLHLDLSLEDGVESVFSIFSLGDAASENDAAENLLPVEFTTDEQTRSSIANLLKNEPSMRSIIAPDKGAILLLVRLDSQVQETETGLSAQLTALRAAIEWLSPPGVSVSLSGIPQVRSSIVAAIIQDQTLLTSLGIILGCSVAWFIFGTARAAIICTIPAFISVLWTLALFAATGARLNLFTTSLPTLALIITYADAIVLYFRWQALNRTQDRPTLDNLRDAVLRVGPASSLTSITTALAFASFSLASTSSMDELAFYGVGAVMFAFLAMITGLPLTAYWVIRWFGNTKDARGPRFTGQGGTIASVTTAAPALVATAALVMLMVLGWIHYQLKPSYALADYMPYGSEIRDAEKYADDVFGGTSQYYVILPVTPEGSFNDEKNRNRLIALQGAVAGQFGDNRTQSLAAAWKRLNQSQIEEFDTILDDAPAALRGRFISKDKRLLQVSAVTSTGTNTLVVEGRIRELQAAIDELPFGSEVKITGLSVLLSKEFPKLIGELRSGLLVSIFLAMLVLAVATRNPALALASLVPNLIPILFTETVIWLKGASLNMTNVIALTIAFGIAIDNAVHVINSYEKIKGTTDSVTADVRAAVAEISPALLASTGIVCVAATITQFSSMPSVAELGVLLISTLIVALISNLAILPSAMILIIKAQSRIFGSSVQEKTT